jgi:hypothetical protein
LKNIAYNRQKRKEAGEIKSLNCEMIYKVFKQVLALLLQIKLLQNHTKV